MEGARMSELRERWAKVLHAHSWEPSAGEYLQRQADAIIADLRHLMDTNNPALADLGMRREIVAGYAVIAGAGAKLHTRYVTDWTPEESDQ